MTVNVLRRPLKLLATTILGLACAARALGESPTPTPAEADVYDTAKQLFDQLAPDDVKQQVAFPSREEFEEFSRALDGAMAGDSLDALAKYEPQARDLLEVLRAAPDASEYADWLAARLEELDMARSIAEARREPTPTPAIRVAPQVRGAGPSTIPYYDRWVRRLRGRPEPANARELMPRLRDAFAAEGAPPELAWLAEVESSLNPNAHNPSGARGLFQLKAETARGLGLSTFLPDQRTDPERSAHAAARLLRGYKDRFGSWPLAIAAYNAGEGRVSRALAAHPSGTYEGIADSLPAGTRIYVPEVCALVAVRTGRSL